ncbi:FAD binding domain-containing protein [Cucurbitaria berberidis CBS 394.84]|uniref:FAD binding domain-containing protein n=1 Tax=Cucurbitaria berberidis CBS 394.84 TaxID=1168544 RepID=A0A9P4GV52_9PLEO|nr:FAD binding domain-containing protein [Cucurbitaria berberidis CBS 394.84]KAF1851591.1 FAD binding domain-containing protein [Cucurbitaria berberidis CBS 394.84]
MQSFVCPLLVALLLGARSAKAVPTQETTQACADITDALPGKVLTPALLGLEYANETQKYWSTALREVDPACIVRPVCAEDVATVVKSLNKYPTVQFAVKSGGHDPNVGHASVQDGVLIVMTDLAGATYDAAEEVAHVKPGGEWNDVIRDLEPSGVTIAGGRLGVVGVGGYLVQGGISFLSAQVGLAADTNKKQNIIGWETVMANGSIVNVNATTQPDIAQAMRGSGSQFGIVTKYTVQTHAIGDVWGGFCIYDASQEDKLYAALHTFVADGAQDPKAAIIFTNLIATGGAKTDVVYYFYDGPTPPTSGPFANFLTIPALQCLPRTQKYSELLRANGEPIHLSNARQSFRTYTLPYIATRPQLYAEIRDKFIQISVPFLTAERPTSQYSVDFQPLPSVIGRISQSKGGNAMGLTVSDPDRVILEVQGSWALASDDTVGHSLSKQLIEWLDVQVPLWLDEAGLSRDVYLPFFMNDAAGDQEVTKSYRDYEKFKALQKSVDPNGLFSVRAGGFKY